METSDQFSKENAFEISQRENTALGEFLHTLVKLNPSECADLEQLVIDTSRRQLEASSSSNTDVRNAKGQTRLHLAAKRREGNLLRVHVGYTRDVNAADCRGNTPLHLLLSSSYTDIDEDLVELAQILLENGANVEAKNCEGKTPLHAAVASSSIEVVQLLLDYGADVKSRDNRGFGVLHYLAASLNNGIVCANVVRILLDLGCDVNAKSQHGRTPLYVAVCTGHDVCFNLFIEHGANIKCKDIKFDTTILHIAVKFAKDYIVDRLIQILAKGDLCERDAMINAKQKDGRTALHLATRHKITSILRLLLRNGADVDALDSYGRTAAHYACQYNNAEAFYDLVDFGTDIGIQDNKDLTPMQLSKDVEPAIWRSVVTRNAKSMAAGLPIVDFRTNLMQIMHRMKSYEKYNVEVAQMKQTMINSKVSVYDLLLNEEKMCRYKNNVVFKEIILFGKLFPSYREMLIGKCRRAGMRRYLIRLSTKALWKMTGYKLEDALSDIIFKELANAELHDFIKAAVIDD